MRALVWSLVVLGLCVGASPALADITGTVVDDVTGLPIDGARVTLRATATRTETDAAGAFSLAVPDGDATIVAAAPGYFNLGASVVAPAASVELRLESVHADEVGGALLDLAACVTCHSEVFTEWSDSRMANAGRNTWVADIYDGSGTPGGAGGFVYVRDSEEATTSPTSECAACHQPLRWLAGAPTALAPHDDPSDGVAHGVSCAVCHQMSDVDLTRPNTPGVDDGDTVSFTRSSDPMQVVMYGAFADVDYMSVGEMRASWNPGLTHGVCATCHQDANDPDHDGDYEEASSIVSEPTYVEWRDSPYADPTSPSYATCADCHMVGTASDLACDLTTGYTRAPGQVRSHRIEGTTAAFLEDAATLTLDAVRGGEEVTVDVTIDNHGTGHHVPTGVTVRNMILLVEVTSGGAPLEHTGAQVLNELAGVGDPAEGYYAGLPGKVYAKRNEGADGAGPVFFTDARAITEDTRIPALGSDATSYTFRIPEGAGDIDVRARLIYRRAWRALVDAKGWTENGYGEPLEDIAPPHYGHLMEEATATLAAPPVDAGAGLDAGPAGPPPSDGCGCRATASNEPEAWALGLAMLVWVRRRRRAVAARAH